MREKNMDIYQMVPVEELLEYFENQEKKDETVADKNDKDKNDLSYYHGFVRFNESDNSKLWNPKILTEKYPEIQSVYEVLL